MTAPSRISAQALAVAEVVLCLATAHVVMKAIKQLSALGRWESSIHLNVTPGWTMMFFAFGVLALARRDFRAYGVDPRTWPDEARRCIAQIAARLRMSAAWCWTGLALYTVGCLAYGFTNLPASGVAITAISLYLAVAPGEEIFFRGYMLTRLNEVFPRRFALGRVRFGFGLVLTSVLFGVIHAFNPVNYFTGQFTFAWALCFSTMISGFLFGFLREATGSIVPGMMWHAAANLAWFTVMPPEAWLWLSKPGA